MIVQHPPYLTSSLFPSPPRSGGSAPFWQESLTGKLRVLLHALPLAALKQSDGRRDVQLRHYDGLALAVKTLDVIVENMGLNNEADRAAVARALSPLLHGMDEAAQVPFDAERHEAMVAKVLAALRNEGERRRPFVLTYQDFDEDGRAVERRLEFRLVVDYLHPAGNVVLRLSNEAANLFLRAIDLDIEDAQAAAEAVVQSQLARGKFEDASQAARNARIQSVQYAEKISRLLHETRRNVQHVDWQTTAPRLLDEALTHLAARLDSEGSILEVSRQRLDVMEPGDSKCLAVLQVRSLVEECRVRHVELHRQVMQARNVFLDEQERQSFRPTPPDCWPSLTTEVLHPLLSAPVSHVAPILDSCLPALQGPQTPKLVSLTDLIDWQLRPRRLLAGDEVDFKELDLTTGEGERPRYEKEVRERVERMLEAVDKPTKLSELLRRCEDDRLTQECLVLMVLQHFAPEDEENNHLQIKVRPGEKLNDSDFYGDELEVISAKKTYK